jgi:hypothetical protein
MWFASKIDTISSSRENSSRAHGRQIPVSCVLCDPHHRGTRLACALLSLRPDDRTVSIRGAHAVAVRHDARRRQSTSIATATPRHEERRPRRLRQCARVGHARARRVFCRTPFLEESAGLLSMTIIRTPTCETDRSFRMPSTRRSPVRRGPPRCLSLSTTNGVGSWIVSRPAWPRFRRRIGPPATTMGCVGFACRASWCRRSPRADRCHPPSLITRRSRSASNGNGASSRCRSGRHSEQPRRGARFRSAQLRGAGVSHAHQRGQV